MSRLWSTILILCCVWPMASCGDDKTTGVDTDSVAPAAVSDLSGERVTEGVVLTWSATGDDGTKGTAKSYEIRSSSDSLDLGNWDAASIVKNTLEPSVSGSIESIFLSGFESDSAFFALRVADEVPNWSQISNVVKLDDVGNGAPEKVTDLRVSAFSTTTMTLAWSSPSPGEQSDESVEYDLRINESSPAADWSQAVRVAGTPTPAAPGSSETLVVADLLMGKAYFFALRASNDSGDWSMFSNVASETTVPFQAFEITTRAGSPGATDPTWISSRQIACAASWSGSSRQVHILDILGGSPLSLTDINLGIANPQSPADGEFVSYRTLEVSDSIWSVDVDGNSSPRILLEHPGDIIFYHDWAPNGQQIVYVTFTKESGVYTLFLASADGENPIPIVSDFGVLRWPSWSPDSQEIAFISDIKGSRDVWIVSVHGGPARLAFSSPADEIDVAWSPRGDTFAVTSNRGGRFDVWIASEGNAEWLQVTNVPDRGYAISPSWSPDGNGLAYSLNSGGSRSSVWAYYFR